MYNSLALSSTPSNIPLHGYTTFDNSVQLLDGHLTIKKDKSFEGDSYFHYHIYGLQKQNSYNHKSHPPHPHILLTINSTGVILMTPAKNQVSQYPTLCGGT